MEATKSVSSKINAAAFGGGGLGVVIAFVYGEIRGEPMPPEVAAGIAGLIAWGCGYLKSEKAS